MSRYFICIKLPVLIVLEMAKRSDLKSSKELFGSHWEYYAYLYLEANDGTIEETETIVFDFNKKIWKTNLISKEEIIQHVWVYKSRLRPLLPQIGPLFHEYLVLQTNQAFWSFEKNTKSLVVQRSPHIEKVREQVLIIPRTIPRTMPRIMPIHEMKSSVVQNRLLLPFFMTMCVDGDLFEQYDVFKSNCQTFGDLNFNRLVDKDQDNFFIQKNYFFCNYVPDGKEPSFIGSTMTPEQVKFWIDFTIQTSKKSDK